MRRKLLSQFVWVTSARAFSSLMQAGLFILVARDLGPDAFGQVASLLGIILVTQSVADGGISTYIVRERGANRMSLEIPRALEVYSRVGVAGAVLYTAAVFAVSVTGSLPIWHLLPLVPWAYFERQADTWLGIALADGDAWHNLVNLLTRRIIGVGAYLLLADLMSVPAALAFSASYFTSALWAYALARVALRKRIGQGSAATISTVVSRSRHYWFNTMGTQLRNLDVSIVGVISGAPQAGYFGAATRVIGPLRMVTTSFASILMPAVARSVAAGGAVPRFGRQGLAAACVFFVFFGSLGVFAPTIMSLLMGPDYATSGDVLRILAFGLFFASFSSLLTAVLQGAAEAKRVGRIALISSTSALVLAAGGAVIAGGTGAAWGLSAAYCLQAGLLYIQLRRLKRSG